jgi:hypothetical protein
MTTLPNCSVRHVPIWIDPRRISAGCFRGRRCRINIHPDVLFVLRAPYGVLAYSGCRAIDRLGFCDRWRRHGHTLGWNLFFAALLVFVFVAALLAVLLTTCTLVGLALLFPLSLDDLFEESVP